MRATHGERDPRDEPRRQPRPRAGEDERDGGDAAATVALQAQWARVRGRLREEYGEPAYRSWLRPLTLVGLADGVLRIAVPARFMRDWVAQHYADRLRALWKARTKR